jgi:hypothetical protein
MLRSYRKTREKALPADWSSGDRLQEKGPATAPSLIRATMKLPSHRPKNSHNRMMTGIGTPSSQSKIPRPMFASVNSSDG